MKQKERPLDELAKVMEPFPQVLYNVQVKEKKDLSEFPEIKEIDINPLKVFLKLKELHTDQADKFRHVALARA
jgi:hypothetical protein